MRCALLIQPEHIAITECPTPQPGPDDVLVAMDTAAICGSDAALFRGKYGVPLPVIPGHEGIGRIVTAGVRVTHFQESQRVVINPNFACGACPVCRRGNYNVCPAKIRLGIDIHGVFAEYVTVPAHSVMVLPESLASEKAIFIEPLAVAYHAFKKARPAAGQRVLVIGAGVLGLLTMQLARGTGAHVTGLDPKNARAAIARRLGASEMIHKADRLTSQPPWDIIYETSGAPEGLSLAVSAAAPAAQIVLIGLPATPHTVSTSLIVRKELQLFGAMIYTDEFASALALLEQDLVDVHPLISGRCTLTDIPRRLSEFAEPHRIKTLVNITS